MSEENKWMPVPLQLRNGKAMQRKELESVFEQAQSQITKLEALLRKAKCPNKCEHGFLFRLPPDLRERFVPESDIRVCDWCTKRDELLNTTGEG